MKSVNHWNIFSWNVNGIRAVSKKGFQEWLNCSKFNIICIQENKASFDKFPTELIEQNEFEIYNNSAKRPGYSGVTTFIKKDIVVKDYFLLNQAPFDDEGRVQFFVFENFILGNCYLPNGGRDHSRVDYKLKCSQEVAELALDAKKFYNLPVVLCGDFNTAHQEIDLTNHKSNKNTTGFLPHERKWMDEFLELGFQDIYRELNPDQEKYTWWSYRNNCRDRNIGWRIDYMMTDQNLRKNVIEAKIYNEIRGSDHCPVGLELEF